jgi:hypothetical protein
MSSSTHCCALRDYFVVAIVGTLKQQAPVEIADFVTDFHNEKGKTTIGMKFCPWCGAPIRHGIDPTKVTTFTNPS